MVEREAIGLTAPGSRGLAVVIAACLLAGACSSEGEALEGDAAVWITTDGLTWVRVADPDLGGPGTQQMTGITSWDRGLVAVGSSALHDRDYDARIWLSEDGTGWRMVTDPNLGGPGSQFINSVAAAGTGLIAVGNSDEGGDLDVVVWTSNDGVEWERITSPDLGGPGDQVIWPFGNPVMVTDELILVSGMDNDHAAIWASTDGRVWSKVDASDVLGGRGEHVISGLVAAGSGSVLGVGSGDLDAAVWTSVDRTTWTRTDRSVFEVPGQQQMTGVIATENGFVAVGDSVSYEEIYFLGRGAKETSDAAIWWSTDSAHWERVDRLEELGDQHIYNVGVLGSTLIAVGVDSPDPRTGGLFDAGSGSSRDVDGAVWMSKDGRSWSRVRSDSLGGENWQDIFDLAELDGVLYAVGGDDYEGVREP